MACPNFDLIKNCQLALEENKDKERYERRILDELSKMFNDSNSFYFSFDYDLTSSLELQNNQN